MRRIVSVATWWVLFVLLWVAYVGTIDPLEVLVGLAFAAIASLALEVVRAQGLLRFRVDRIALAQALTTPAQVVYDFALVTWLLVRHRRPAGEYVTVDYPAGDAHAQYAWRRAWVTTIGTISPNVLVIDIDPERKTAVLHSLAPRAWRGSQPL